ncbi:hypothetical protein [Enterovibrio norvegicus]|uniref:hypothetical protein n=1 Tax=Enterovibrio norvegicus TaxID=188144 RepID=UPI0013011165|nr:hypothetical protein [Enterovibrio norvegicus]
MKQPTSVLLFESNRYEADTSNMPEQLKGEKQLAIFLDPSYYPLEHVAALRCEQRYHETLPYHRKH